MRIHPAIVFAFSPAWVLPAPAAEPLPFEGKWALRAEWCQSHPGPPSEERPQPIMLTARRLVTDVMACEFTSVLPGGVSFRVEADCIAGAERGHEFFGFARIGDRLHWSWAGQTGTFVPCAN
jgi:hypothetical protein